MSSNDTQDVPPELRLPEVAKIFRSHNIIPLVIYFLFFRFASRFVKRNCWLGFTGFKRYRLQNLSICFLHSTVSGILNLFILILYPHDMLTNVIHWWNPIAAHLPLISIGYFIHDSIDMISYEWSQWTIELLFHHAATCLSLITPAASDRFLMATTWALLMEVNSIFLHARTILQLCGLSGKFPRVYNTILNLNIVTFIIFRFILQSIFFKWVIDNYDKMHLYYYIAGVGGESVFVIINGLLFVRLLASDGFLTKSIGSGFVMNRDEKVD